MQDGKIVLIKEKTLYPGSASYKLLESVMYDVVKIDPANVQIVDLNPLLKITEADVIVPIGEKSLNYIANLHGITKYAGTVQTAPSGIPVVPIVSPGFIDHNPNYLRKFAEDMLVAYHISMGIKKEEVENQYKVVTDMVTLAELILYIKQTGYCCFDFETTELTDMGTFDPDFYCTSLSISFQQGSSYVIPLYHKESPFSDTQIKFIFHELNKRVFGNPNITKVGHHIKFDMHCLAWCGVTEFRGPFHDTMLMHQLYDENLSHKLKDIVRDFFPRFANYEKAITKDWANIPLNDLARYNALDSDLTFRLYWVLTDILLKDDHLYLMYRNLTAAATKAFFKVEETGMLVDKDFITESIRNVEELIEDQESIMRMHTAVTKFDMFKTEQFRIDTINNLVAKLEKCQNAEFKSKTAQTNNQRKITELENQISGFKSGTITVESQSINFNSPDQLKELFFSKEGFNFKKPENHYGNSDDSTGADNLSLINDKSGFIEQLMVYRQLKKLVSTYLESILNKLDENHFIHTNFNQHVAKTGRLSSDKPNLQNIITRTKYKVVEDSVSLVKQSFTVPEGYTLVSADYSQMELRLIAHYAQETAMIDAYRNNQDLHEITAANSHGYTLDEFKVIDHDLYKQYRFEAKAENFGFIYGISPEGFREYARTTYNLNISLNEAKKRREAYFKKYPNLLTYHKLYKEKGKKFKYVRTFFGRKVHLPDIDSINEGVRSHAERNAINSPIQGTGGELTIWALTLLSNRLDPKILIVNEIHDAIYFYVPDSILDESIIIIRETMEKLPLKKYFYKEIDSLPIKVEFETSKKNWKSVSPYLIN
jgi:DNA polymerase-1